MLSFFGLTTDCLRISGKTTVSTSAWQNLSQRITKSSNPVINEFCLNAKMESRGLEPRASTSLCARMERRKCWLGSILEDGQKMDRLQPRSIWSLQEIRKFRPKAEKRHGFSAKRKLGQSEINGETLLICR